MKVAINEAGIETITINEFLILCKKNNITKATKSTAINKSCTTASAASRVKIVLSFAISSSKLLAL